MGMHQRALCLLTVALCVSALFSGAVFGLSHRTEVARRVAALAGLTVAPVLLWCMGEIVCLDGHHAQLAPLGALVGLWMFIGNLGPMAMIVYRWREMRFSFGMLVVGATHTAAWASGAYLVMVEAASI